MNKILSTIALALAPVLVAAGAASPFSFDLGSVVDLRQASSVAISGRMAQAISRAVGVEIGAGATQLHAKDVPFYHVAVAQNAKYYIVLFVYGSGGPRRSRLCAGHGCTHGVFWVNKVTLRIDRHDDALTSSE